MANSTTNINSSFFNGIYKEVWRKTIPQGLTEAETSFILQAGQLVKGDAVLDMMCGYGRHALALASSGIKVRAVDNSAAYINELSKEAIKNNLTVAAQVSDVLKFNTKDHFKTIICMGNSFSFFNQEDIVIFLNKMASFLEDNGVIIINSCMIAEIVLRHFQQKVWENLEGFKYLLDFKYYFFPARIESEHTIIPEKGITETLKGVDYIYSLNELSHFCHLAGLKIKNLFSTPKQRPFSIGDSNLYIVIEKL
ncbi:MAG: class I SAM-dependent methyltransferase [Flavisolibacter sp.]